MCIARLHEQIDETLVAMTGVVLALDVRWAELIQVPKYLQVEKSWGSNEVSSMMVAGFCEESCHTTVNNVHWKVATNRL